MRRDHPLPALWLMTDERMGDALWRALARLPRGSGVVFRHHATPRAARRRVFEAVRRIARARRLVLVLAGSERDAIGWRADGWHGRSAHVARLRPRTASVHDRAELAAARRCGAARIFLSPVFTTRSHSEARPLGRVRFGLIAGGARGVIALGGMDARRFRALRLLGAEGWAAIDAWTPRPRA